MKITEIKSQKGGLLVEALAILGIVAVTSPMIYKKKIDKAQELEDIAKASQMKIIKDAVANYVDAKYKHYVLEDGETTPKTEIITLNDIADFLPPGFDQDKTIKIGIRSEKVNGNDKVSAIVVDSEKFNEKRGNRVASLIGADGGYAGLDGTAVGNNSVWSIDPTKFGFAEGEVKSQIVSTTQFSKSAASGEYLYKYKVEGQPQVNMMMTNINMRGNDLNNASSVGLMYGRNDKFDAWRLNGYENDGQQYGDGTIVGKNTSGFDTVALQSNRRRDAKGNPTDIAGKIDGKGHNSLELFNGDNGSVQDGSGALTLRAMKGNNTAGGCTEALANSDIGVGNGAGIFTACNNNASRTAYLIADGEKNGGELRVRKDGNPDAGATAYSDTEDKGAAFTVTDNDGKVTGFIASNKSNSVNLFFKNDAKTEDNSAMELMSSVDGNSKVVAVANSDGGSVALKDAADKETVRMIGEEATVVVTAETNGTVAAGITGKNQKSNDVHDGYFGEQLSYNNVISGRLTSDEKNPVLTGGALFVRNSVKDTHDATPDAAKTVVLVSGTSETAKSGILTMGNTNDRNVLISSEKGSSMSLANEGISKITVEGDRKSGAVNGVSSTALSKSGYFEVVGSGDVNNPSARSEIYASLSGRLVKGANDAKTGGFDNGLGTFYGSGSVADDKNGGGSYLAYNNNTGTVKLMASGAYDGVAEDGGTIELTPADNGNDKAVITTAMKSELEGSNVGAAARLSGITDNKERYAHFGANSIGNGGEMVLSSPAGRVEALGSQNSGGSMYFKRGDGNKGVAMTAADGDNGNVKVYGESETDDAEQKAKVEINGAEARVMNVSGETTGVLGTGGLSLRNATGKEKSGVEFSKDSSEGLQFYNPEGKKAVFAATDTFQTGQNNKLELELQGNGESAVGMNSGISSLVGKSDSVIKGAILIRNDLAAATITAPIVKTDGNLKFKDICILGKTGTGDDSPCLSDAAAYSSGYSQWKDKYGDLSAVDDNNEVNFGRALWQLVFDRVINLLESTEHNDTHHLKAAWSGEKNGNKVTVSGRNIETGDAFINGEQGVFEYLNDDDEVSYNYLVRDAEGRFTSVKADEAKSLGEAYINAVNSKNPGLKVSYYNIESGKKEVIGVDDAGNTMSLKYNDYNKYAKGESQYAAAGHEHGATRRAANRKYPVYSSGSGNSYSDGRGYIDGQLAPQAPNEYAAKGHYHLNYNAAASGCVGGYVTYKVKRIKKGKVCSSYSDCVEEKEVKLSCDGNLSGDSFYQGTGGIMDYPDKKWNTGGLTRKELSTGGWSNYY